MIGFQGDEPGKVQKAIAKIKEIIQQGIDVSFQQILNTLWKLSSPSPLQLPEGSNQLRQMQLRELAMLNGTLREDGVVSSLLDLIELSFPLDSPKFSLHIK